MTLDDKIPTRKTDNKSTVFAKDFSIFDAPIVKEKRPVSDLKGVIDEEKLFKKTIIDDRNNPLDQTLPVTLHNIVKEIGIEYPSKILLSKLEVFIEVMKRLEEENNGLVVWELLVTELEKTGVFSPIKIRPFITQMYRTGTIYEPKGDYFRLS